MTGQVALVTGGIRGIGRAISERLAARGVEVAAGYSHGKAGAEKFVADHPRASVHQGNIGSDGDCERVIQEVLDRHGRLDILVNNAGITLDKTVRKMTVNDWDHVIQVNLSGAFYLSRAILQHMLDRGSGRIINISSVIGEAGNIGQANYAVVQGRPVRPDHEPRAGDRPQGHHRQRRDTRLHLHRDGRRPSRRRPWTGSLPRSRSAASASPTRSPASWSSSPTRSRASSRARSIPSTAASTCSAVAGGPSTGKVHEMTGVQPDLVVNDRTAPPSALVIFGASGDLTRRKLVPGLANLARHKRLPDEFAVVGVGRSDFDDEAFRRHMSDAAMLPPRLVEQFRFVRGGYDDPQTYRALARCWVSWTPARARPATGYSICRRRLRRLRRSCAG